MGMTIEMRAVIETHRTLLPEVRTFIETGTASGETSTWALTRGGFSTLWTCEPVGRMFSEAARRFSDAGVSARAHQSPFGSVRFLQDVREVLESTPAVIWIDSHWCGEGTHADLTPEGVKIKCPILQELEVLETIQVHPQSLILIDDFNSFGSEPGFPTSEEVLSAVARTFPDRLVEVYAGSVVIMSSPVP